MHRFAPAVLLALAAAPAAAQAGGFQAGDLYLYNPAYQGLSSTDGAIVRVDPGTGATAMLVDLVTSSSGPDQMAYDPWRDRLIFFGGLVPNHNEVYLADAAGNLQSLGLGVTSGPAVGRFAPRGDGLIYFVSHTSQTNVFYFDAANQVQVLMDAGGAAPYAFPGGVGSVRHLEHHAATNALVAAISDGVSICSGGGSGALNLRVLSLSADGTRVVGETCFQYDLDPSTGGEVPVGLSAGPGQDLVLHVDDNSTGLKPRMARVDPGAGAAGAFASSATAATSGGCYSRMLGGAVMLDSGADELRAYAEGSAGPGVVIATGTGAPGGSGETAALVEIAPVATGHLLAASPSALSLSAGGAQAWTLAFGAAHAGEVHVVLGSLSGWTPATSFAGAAVPLVLDAYGLWTASHQSSALLQGTLGLLDAQGGAAAALVLPPGVDPSLAGAVAYHAALALAPDGSAAATNPVPLTFLP